MKSKDIEPLFDSYEAPDPPEDLRTRIRQAVREKAEPPRTSIHRSAGPALVAAAVLLCGIILWTILSSGTPETPLSIPATSQDKSETEVTKVKDALVRRDRRPFCRASRHRAVDA